MTTAAPVSENAGSQWTLISPKNAINATAPNVAPPVTPIISGEAIGFLSTFCQNQTTNAKCCTSYNRQYNSWQA